MIKSYIHIYKVNFFFKKRLIAFIKFSGLQPRSKFLKILPKGLIGAELGVFQGEFSVDLIKVAKPQKIFLVDPWWKAIGEFYTDWANMHNNGNPLPTKLAYEQSKERIKAINAEKIAKFIIDDDLNFLKSLADNSLDWVYIDSTHKYEQTKFELKELNRIIKPNGLITGHDWFPNPNHMHHGVYKAVSEFCQSNNWRIATIDSIHNQWAIRRNT